MTAKPSHTDHIEASRRILNAPASTLSELEAAGAVIQHVRAETDIELQDMAARRKTIASADSPTAEIEKALARHDEAARGLTNRNEIAAAVASKLEERIAADRETERVAQRQAAYEKTLERHIKATGIVKDFTDRVGPESREVMRKYIESEIETAAVNRDLPPGAAPIPSIEFERKGELQPTKTTVRHFKAFVHQTRRIAEQGYVQAAQRPDGRWEVHIPGTAHQRGDYYTCGLHDFVEVTREEDGRLWPVNLATALSMPAFYAGQQPWWTPHEVADYHSISRALEALESRPPHHFPPRVETRVMRLAEWQQMNGGQEEQPAYEPVVDQPADAAETEVTAADVAAE